MKISCAVLDNGQRVLTHDAFLSALGRAGRPNVGVQGSEVPIFLAAKNIKPYISDDLIRATTTRLTAIPPCRVQSAPVARVIAGL